MEKIIQMGETYETHETGVRVNNLEQHGAINFTVKIRKQIKNLYLFNYFDTAVSYILNIIRQFVLTDK